MNDWTFADKCWLVIFGFVLLVLTFMAGGSFVGNALLNEAVSKGHAEYYLDANHNKQWRWKEAK